MTSLQYLFQTPFHPAKNSMTDVQRWMLDDLTRRISACGEMPGDLDGPSALRELGSDDFLYTQGAAHLAEFDAAKTKILHRRLKPTPAHQLLPPDARAYVEHFQEFIERPEAELEAKGQDDTMPEPYWDPRLKRSSARRMELYHLLWQCGLLTFRKRRKARAGIFAVKKKDGMQRLIVDARQANWCHHRPPKAQLSTAAGMLSLDLSPETLESHGFGEPFAPCFEAGDVSDCFYNFQIHQLASWFAFDDRFSVQHLWDLGFAFDEIFDDATHQYVAVSPTDMVFPCFGGLPMGWSWALFLANESIVHQATAHRQFAADDIIRDRARAPDVLPDRPAVGVYVDNIHVFSGSMGGASDRMQYIEERFSQLGIPFITDHVEKTLVTDSSGITLDFRERMLARPKHRRSWRLWLALHELSKRHRLHGRLLQIVMGHLVHHFQLARSGLSIFSACYRFIADHGHHRAVMWPSVRRELRLALGLVFAVEVDLGAPTCKEVHLGDASNAGYSLMVTSATSTEVREALRDREKWHFVESDEVVPGSLMTESSARHGDLNLSEDDVQCSHYIGSSAEVPVGLKTQYGRSCVSRKQNPKGDLFKPGKRAQDRTIIRGPAIPPISQRWSMPDRWKLLTAKAWQDESEHINLKEGRVLLMGLRRLCRSRANLGLVALSITDNLTCALVLEKGRSSSAKLNFLCRRVAAYEIAGGIQWRIRHVKSELNVADAPSRRFSSVSGPQTDSLGR
jgi:hypothetical protein